jgi:NAD(P)-dependent dehydrogenase (short-subunit alcohol dehydrogenase family)
VEHQANARLTILIIGGYGTFGGRLAELLAQDERVTLLIAGRSEERAQRFISTLSAGASKRAVAFDRQAATAADIRALAANIVVDATGPFQQYGDDPYRLVRNTVEAGANYMDLADSSAFVGGIDQFDSIARAAGVYVLSGVSSFPVLTAAVLRHLSVGLSEIDTMRGGIAPSPHAVVGRNVIEAILSYAGKPLPLIRDGRKSAGHGLTETMRYTIAPPGHLPLWNTRFSLVDVPDLLLIPAATPGLRTVWMGAGTRPEFLHQALNGLAWLVRLKLLPSLSWLSGIVFHVQRLLRWGEHRGGMFVEVLGTGPEGPVRRSWHLAAEGSDGPYIPSMAVQALVLRQLEGNIPEPGARSAIAALELADYDRVFAGRTLYSGIRDDAAAPQPLYARLLGSAWDRLPEPIRAMHTDVRKARGQATVEAGHGIRAKLARRLFGFPSGGEQVPVAVEFTTHDSVETWTRSFGGQSFSSIQSAGSGRNDRLMVERFGPVRIALAVVSDDHGLRLVIRRWSLFGLPMPLALGPRGGGTETVEQGRFTFDVEIGHALTGMVVRYRGWLILEA